MGSAILKSRVVRVAAVVAVVEDLGRMPIAGRRYDWRATGAACGHIVETVLPAALVDRWILTVLGTIRKRSPRGAGPRLLRELVADVMQVSAAQYGNE